MTPGRLVNVDSRKIYIVEHIPPRPSTSPTVIIIPGLGSTSVGWAPVQRLLPPHIRSFTYDRLGLGQSDRTSLPRPASTLAQELKRTLEVCAIPAPYLLVAHSYGGIIGREFLELYGRDVAGLVCVDANQENTHRTREWPFEATGHIINTAWTTDDATGLADSYRCSQNEWTALKTEETARRLERERGCKSDLIASTSSEGTSYVSSLDALALHHQFEKRALGNRPLSVIMGNLARDFERMCTAGKLAGRGTSADHDVAKEFCQRLPGIELGLCTEMLKLSGLHRLIVTSVSGHLVHLWEPELCVQEIMWCLSENERGQQRGCVRQ